MSNAKAEWKPKKSPTPPKSTDVKIVGKVLLTFPEAMKVVINGGKVAKEDWQAGVYASLDTEYLKIRLSDGKDHEFLVRRVDMESEDWFVV